MKLSELEEVRRNMSKEEFESITVFEFVAMNDHSCVDCFDNCYIENRNKWNQACERGDLNCD